MNPGVLKKEKSKFVGAEWIPGKHILITGASSGIGRELCYSLLGKCNKLSLVARNQSRLNALQSELNSIQRHGKQKTKIWYYPIDICNVDSTKWVIDRIYNDSDGPIHAFINCAGGCHIYDNFDRLSHEDITTIFRTNAEAPIHWLRELLPRMKEQNKLDGDDKRGHIILISSRSGERVLPNLIVYGAAKMSLDGLVDGLRREYSKYDIIFTTIHPGSIDTKFANNWNNKNRKIHADESMHVTESISSILHALNKQYAINKISYESVKQWNNELGVL